MTHIKYQTFQLPSCHWKQTKELRLAVFVDEQGVPEELEIDDNDATALHFIATLQHQLIGTLRLNFKRKTAKLGRLAIAKTYRHQGIATQLMQKAAHFCQYHDINKIELAAQVIAKDFYTKLQYRESGDTFMDAGIPHVLMIKHLHAT